MEKKDTPESIADHINRSHKALDGLVRKHCVGSAVLTIFSIGVFFAAYAGLVFLFPSPSHEELVKSMDRSNTELARLAMELSRAIPQSQASGIADIQNTVNQQSRLHKQAFEDIRETQRDIPPQGVSLLQLLGGSAILALLGYLGLQRLQTIDTEITSLRDFMFSQIKERVGESREILKATVDEEVDNRFEKTKTDLDKLTGDFTQTTRVSAEEFSKSAQTAQSAVKDVEGRITALLQRYNWLDSSELREAADVVSRVSSVEQAHAAAVRFNQTGMAHAANLALSAIVQRQLKGDANEYHNAHTEAMRMDDPVLGLQIVEEGLKQYPEQFDLMADKARCMISVGRVTEALSLLDNWRKDRPREFFRSWRPVVFYAQAICAGNLTDGRINDLKAVFDEAIQQLPYEVKPWSEYAEFLESINQSEQAESILRKSVLRNPYAQQLNYVLGELLLKQGRAQESIPFLEMALQCDYQPQFQHDVSQEAIRVTLAQAYEAANSVEKAAALYKLTLDTSGKETSRHVVLYCHNRLLSIAARQTLQEGSRSVASVEQEQVHEETRESDHQDLESGKQDETGEHLLPPAGAKPPGR